MSIPAARITLHNNTIGHSRLVPIAHFNMFADLVLVSGRVCQSTGGVTCQVDDDAWQSKAVDRTESTVEKIISIVTEGRTGLEANGLPYGRTL